MFTHHGLVLVLILLYFVTPMASAQTSTPNQGQAQDTQALGYWTDPATGLMWAGKDNGKDVSWGKAKKYCHNLRLGGFSDWRLPTIEELQGIFGEHANAPGLGAGKHGKEAMIWRVKGNLFLTGHPWSSSQILDERGRPRSLVWHFDFCNGTKDYNDVCWFAGDLNDGMRALCVRRP